MREIDTGVAPAIEGWGGLTAPGGVGGIEGDNGLD